LQQGSALGGGIAAAGERFLQPGGQPGIGKILVVWVMFPALRKVVAAKQRPMRDRSSAVRGTMNPTGARAPLRSVGVSTVSCQAGSTWRSYQATYSSTMAQVAGWVVTSSIGPAPRTWMRRPSRRLAR